MSARTDGIVDWLRQRLAQTGARGFVVGLSGGLDSSTVAASMSLVAEPPHAFTARYHGSGKEAADETGLARELARLAERPDARIAEVSMDAAGLPTPRPKFAALSNAKLAMAGIEMPTWQDALARYVTRVRNEQRW